MNLESVGSIFDLSQSQIDFYTKRLVPHKNDAQGFYGCSSVTGFLANGERLLKRGNKDKKILDNRQITYRTIAERLETIFKLARNEKPGTLIEGKFSVTIGESSFCSQFCPFSPVFDDEASPFATISGACGQSNLEFTINNTLKKRSIKVSMMLIHLIRDHHFFEGKVPHRLDPKKLIKTLEIKPETNFSSSITPLLATSAPQLLLEVPQTWQFCGEYPINSNDLPNQIAIKYDKQLIKFENEVIGLILPYPNDFNDESEIGLTQLSLNFLHLFNLGDSQQLVSGSVDGAKFTDIKIPSMKRMSIINTTALPVIKGLI